MEIALFGGSFNPPHIGHVLNAVYVLAAYPVDELWILPVFCHPFTSKRNLLPFSVRLELCERAFLPMGPRVKVTRLEEMAPMGSKTVDLLEWLLPQHPDDHFHLVIGSDILGETHLWKRFDRIRELVSLIVVPREGYPDPTLTGPVIPKICSTEIRRQLSQGIDPGEMLPWAVREYFNNHPTISFEDDSQ